MLNVKVSKKGVKRYMCWKNNNSGRSVPGCGVRSMICEVVDDSVWQMLREICKSTDSLKRYLKATAPKEPQKKSKRRDNQEQLAKIKAERKSIMAWFSQQLLTHEEASERLESLKKAEESLMKENIPTTTPKPQRSLQAIVDAVSTCEDSLPVKRELVKSLIDKVILTRTDKSVGRKKYELAIQIVFR
jgi:ATPase subunit of ABC transporter with duplicated ATPase domains